MRREITAAEVNGDHELAERLRKGVQSTTASTRVLWTACANPLPREH